MPRRTDGHARGMVDIAGAADMLGCSDTYVRRLVRRGKLVPKDQMGGAPLFYRCDVAKFADTIVGGRNPLNRCGLCDRPLGETVVEWGPLRTRLHPSCSPELDRRIVDTLDARYCPVCLGTRTLDMPGDRLDEHEPVPCVCIRRPGR